MTAARLLESALEAARRALRDARMRQHRMRSHSLLADAEVLSAHADVVAAELALHEAERRP